MKKLFISQPMNGKSEEDIRKVRKIAVKQAKKVLGEDVEVLETYIDLGEDAKPLEYIGESIKILAKADIVFMCDDWHKYRGCYIEQLCATNYYIPIIFKLNNRYQILDKRNVLMRGV